MLIFIDSEGEPVQEFSAIYVSADGTNVLDVFHRYVQYPYPNYDYDSFSRRYIHGLDCDFLFQHGLPTEGDLVTTFLEWLEHHPYTAIYAHAPAKEKKLFAAATSASLLIRDISLRPWKDRRFESSHRKALAMKINCVPVCGVTCSAHNSVCWRAKNVKTPSAADCAKMDFLHHCSLYDCIECLFFYLQEE